jgi:hypothetical protein
MKAPKKGGPATQLWTGSSDGAPLAIDSRNAYWVSIDDFMMIPIDGGNAASLANLSQLFCIAADDMGIYGGVWGANAAIMRFSLSGGGSPSVLATDGDAPSAIALDQANIYWTDYDGGTVMQIPR